MSLTLEPASHDSVPSRRPKCAYKSIPIKETLSIITQLVAKIPDLDPLAHELFALLHLIAGFLLDFWIHN